MDNKPQETGSEVERSRRRAYLVGGGIAALASAVYLITEGGLRGNNIHILNQEQVNGGALDGSGSPEQGYLIRGGRMHEEHFVCTWDLLSKIPTLHDPGMNVTEEIFAFNQKVVTCSTSRLLKNGEKMDVSSYGLSQRDSYDMLRLILHSEESLGATRIDEWFAPEFFNTVFWLLWSTTFAFQPWSSVVEMRRYFQRFIHLLPGFNQLRGIMRTVYNQYDSVVLPIEGWLKAQGVQFQMGCRVTDIDFALTATQKCATALHTLQAGAATTIELADSDLLFVTLGSMVENATIGSMRTAAVLNADISHGSWALWKRIAEKDAAFGHPGVFCDNIDESKWMSFTVTLKDPTFFEHMEVFTGNKAGTGGLVTFTDSNWFMSVVLAYQPHFINQPDGVFVFWGDGLFPDREGNYVKKPMSDCSGEEILAELFYHLRIEEKMKSLMEQVNCIPCMMPFIDSQFQPRLAGDRPQVVPSGATNFAFLGQFVEVPKDCVFTVEYSVRTAQTAVFTLLNLEREVSPMYEGSHDVHVLIEAFKAVNR
jgi:oleate hydratase